MPKPPSAPQRASRRNCPDGRGTARASIAVVVEGGVVMEGDANWSSQTAVRVRLREGWPRRPTRRNRPSGTKRWNRDRVAGAYDIQRRFERGLSCGIVGTIWEPSGRNRSNAEGRGICHFGMTNGRIGSKMSPP